MASIKVEFRPSTIDCRRYNLLLNHSESCNPSVKDGLPTPYVRVE